MDQICQKNRAAFILSFFYIAINFVHVKKTFPKIINRLKNSI